MTLGSVVQAGRTASALGEARSTGGGKANSGFAAQADAFQAMAGGAGQQARAAALRHHGQHGQMMGEVPAAPASSQSAGGLLSADMLRTIQGIV